MKQAVNFRLSRQTTHTISLLEKKMHVSKTAIVEKAIQFYAKKKLAPQNVLLEFAGTLHDNEANSMLNIIQTSKYNKDKEIKL